MILLCTGTVACGGGGAQQNEEDPGPNTGGVQPGTRLDATADNLILRESYFVDMNLDDSASQDESVLGTMTLTDERGTYEVDYDTTEDFDVNVGLKAFRTIRSTTIADSDLDVCPDGCNRAYVVLYADGPAEGFWQEGETAGLPILYSSAEVENSAQRALVISQFDIPAGTTEITYGDLNMPTTIDLVVDFRAATDGERETTFVIEYLLTHVDTQNDDDSDDDGNDPDDASPDEDLAPSLSDVDDTLDDVIDETIDETLGETIDELNDNAAGDNGLLDDVVNGITEDGGLIDDLLDGGDGTANDAVNNLQNGENPSDDLIDSVDDLLSAPDDLLEEVNDNLDNIISDLLSNNSESNPNDSDLGPTIDDGLAPTASLSESNSSQQTPDLLPLLNTLTQMFSL